MTDLLKILLASTLAILLTGCPQSGSEAPEATDAPATADTPSETTGAATEGEAEDPVPDFGGADRSDAQTVKEAWASPFHEPDNIDSVAFWHGEHDGATVSWVMATGKESHDLVVYDANNGSIVRRVGGPGAEAGQFQRPNGIMVHGDLALVVERDNHRIQVLGLPGFETRALVGADVLRRPYGLTVTEDEPGVLEVYVTDNYETAEGEIPPDAELGKRVKHLRIFASATPVDSEHVRSFGDTEGPGVLTKVETIFVDDLNGRLLIANEHADGMAFAAYDLEGNFTGELVGKGHFFHEAEGLALRSCGETGHWIATDQAPDVSLFRVFDQNTFEYRGTFVGPLTANTDGVTLTSMATEAFPAGAFFAVHDDQGVTAFDWRHVAEALGLPPGC